MCQRHPVVFACNHLLLLLVVSLAASGGARAQGAHTLEGRVVLPDGSSQPRNPVRVTLTYNGRRIYETFTDLSGRYTFTALASGRYQLTAEGDGTTFETTSVYADVTAFGAAPQTFTQNIQLIAKRGTIPPSPATTASIEALDPDTPTAAREKYQKAMKSAEENKTEQAAKLLAEAISEHPTFYTANLALAEQYTKLKRYDEALAAYRRASELKPDRPEPYVGVGVTLVNQKRYDEGITLLRRLIEMDERLAAPYLSLGYAEMMTGDYAAAERHLRRAIELSKPPIAHIYLANIYELTDAPAKAIEHLEAYLKESPRSENAASVRGAIEKLRKKLKEKK